MTLGPAGAKQSVSPIGISLSVVAIYIYEVIVCEVACFLLPLDILCGIHDFRPLTKRVESHLHIIEYLTVLGFTSLGGNENDTVSGLCTVNGGRCGILKNLDILNHLRVKVLDIVHLKTVHNKKWSDISGVGRITADTDIGLGTRST